MVCRVSGQAVFYLLNIFNKIITGAFAVLVMLRSVHLFQLYIFGELAGVPSYIWILREIIAPYLLYELWDVPVGGGSGGK